MAGVDELVRARADFERGEWSTALDRWSGLDPATLTGEDLTAAAAVAHLLGRMPVCVDLYRRAYDERLAAGDVAGAVRCAFHVSMAAITVGDTSTSAGWAARAERLVDDLPEGSVEAGYVTFARIFGHLRAGRLEEAWSSAVDAADTARRHDDTELLARSLCAQGRLSIYAGRVPDGLSFLDESMVEATTHDLEPITVGFVYCTAIEGCQEVADIGRVSEWTELLQHWVATQPQLVVFTGQCSLHRAQVLRARGAWAEALEELDAAIERYERAAAVDAVGQAAYERGELLRLRGDLDAAEDSFRLSAERGYDPQPGLAELWLARGSATAAVRAVRRVLAETRGEVARCRVLPGVVRVLVATGDAEGAREAAGELEQLAAAFGSEALQVEAALAAGAALRAAGDAVGALPYLRKARQLAAQLDLAHPGAVARTATGLALRAVGDEESARRELAAAREALSALGARPELDALEAVLDPAGRPRGLSEREVEVLRLVAAGRSNAQIATELVLSERTVARHLSNIFTKLDVGSRTAAAAFAFEHDLVRR